MSALEDSSEIFVQNDGKKSIGMLIKDFCWLQFQKRLENQNAVDTLQWKILNCYLVFSI